MAAKVIATCFLLALAAAAVSAEDDCTCDPQTEEDSRALWDFLKKLSGNDLADADEQEMRAVLPGVLSPLLECNCLEKNRRKRKITPEVEEEKVELEVPASAEPDPIREKKSIHIKTTRCAKGFVWIGIMCVPEEYLD